MKESFIKKTIYNFYLFLLSIPGIFMTKKANAKFHLKYICPRCPKWRRRVRYVFGKKCFWEDNWKNGNYSIPRAWVGSFENLKKVFLHKTLDYAKFKKTLK